MLQTVKQSCLAVLAYPVKCYYDLQKRLDSRTDQLISRANERLVGERVVDSQMTMTLVACERSNAVLSPQRSAVCSTPNASTTL